MSAPAIHDPVTAAHHEAVHNVHHLAVLGAKRRSLLDALNRSWAGEGTDLRAAVMEKVNSLEVDADDAQRHIRDDINAVPTDLRPALSGAGFALPSDTSGLVLVGYFWTDLVLVSREFKALVLRRRPGGTAVATLIDLDDYDAVESRSVTLDEATTVAETFCAS